MPFYEYQCERCGHELEVLQKISDPPLTECPECAQPALKKLVSAAGFRLKGSGWYETDFKGGKKKNLHEGVTRRRTARRRRMRARLRMPNRTKGRTKAVIRRNPPPNRRLPLRACLRSLD